MTKKIDPWTHPLASIPDALAYFIGNKEELLEWAT